MAFADNAHYLLAGASTREHVRIKIITALAKKLNFLALEFIIMEEQNKFLAWHQEEKARGLVDLKFFAGDGCSTKNSTSEDFFREANTVNALFEQGATVERKDVF